MSFEKLFDFDVTITILTVTYKGSTLATVTTAQDVEE
jgi:hypothetical protein